MDKALVCGSGLCGFIYQTVHPTGFGALEDCPNYSLRSALRLWLCHLTDRREMAFNTKQGLLLQYLHRCEVEAGAGFSPAWAGTCASAKPRPWGYLT